MAACDRNGQSVQASGFRPAQPKRRIRDFFGCDKPFVGIYPSHIAEDFFLRAFGLLSNDRNVSRDKRCVDLHTYKFPVRIRPLRCGIQAYMSQIRSCKRHLPPRGTPFSPVSEEVRCKKVSHCCFCGEEPARYHRNGETAAAVLSWACGAARRANE